MIIKLKFEPCSIHQNREKARKYGIQDPDEDYYVAQKENKCVVCGSFENYTRFFIIPSLYRTYLPKVLKAHRSHDIVLLCFGCQQVASRRQANLTKKLSEENNLPLSENSLNKNKNVQIQTLNRTASTLKNAGDKIPKKKKEDLHKLI